MCLLAARPKLRSPSPSAMPRRQPRLPALITLNDLPPRIRAALLSIELPDCNCKLSLTPVCLIGAEPGCRERRACGTCPCRPRYLPACQLDHPGGCVLRREGKSCKNICGRMTMPECLSPGCNLRRRGRLCDCPRWPGHPCEHITAYAHRMRMLGAALTLSAGLPPGSDLDSQWALLLWVLYPKRYGGRELPGIGAKLLDRTERVTEMATRRALGVSLWHPGDRRYPAGEGGFSTLAVQFRNFGMRLSKKESIHVHCG